jgi:rubrerythrin
MSEKTVAARLPSDQLFFLDQCARLELKMADLYRYFEALFVDTPAFSLLWQKTANEEENHYQQFYLGVKLKGVGMENVNTDVAQAKAYLQKVETYLEKVMVSRPTMEEALTLAIELEKRLVTLHMSSIVRFEDQGLKKMFKAMMESDEGHVTMLTDFLTVLNGSKGNVG